MAAEILVELSSRRFAYPVECPCCGSEPDAELVIPRKASKRTVAPDSAKALTFPYCRRCVEHVVTAERGGMTAAAVTLLGLIAGAVIGVLAGVLLGLAVAAAAIAAAALTAKRSAQRAKAQGRGSCAATRPAVVYLGWSGTTSAFTFASASYTAKFAEQNASALAATSAALKRLLDGFKVARLQVPTPAAASRTVPPARDLDEWLAYIARQPSRVLQRIALARALEMIDDEAGRKRLIDDTCRTELARFLTRIERLARASKRRELQQAIAELRADNVPDALRDAELRILEGAL